VSVLQLAETRFGARLVECLSKVPSAQHIVAFALQSNGHQLAASKQGRHLVELLSPCVA